MGATRRNLETQPKILKKLSEHQIYQSKRLFPQKNYVSNFKSVKEPKMRMGASRRNLQAQPKSYKNDRNTKSTNQIENFLKKSMFSSLKV
jgi:hypothetical protein